MLFRSVALAANKDLAKTAAYLEAGRMVNNKLVLLIAPRLPIMVRGYASEPLGKLALANLFLVLVQKFKPDNQALAKLAYAGVTQAYTEVFQGFNIEAIVDGFLKDNVIANALNMVEANAAQ